MQGIFKTVVPIFQAEELGFTPLAIGLLGTFGTIGVVVMSVFGGYLINRTDHKTILIGGTIATAIANVGYLVFPTFLGHVFMGLLNGFGEGMMIVVLPILVSEMVGESVRGTAIGANRTIFSIGKFMGPIAASTLVQFSGSIQPTFCLFTAIQMVGILLILTLKDSYSSGKSQDSVRGSS